jgi:hypothetical protein
MFVALERFLCVERSLYRREKVVKFVQHEKQRASPQDAETHPKILCDE